MKKFVVLLFCLAASARLYSQSAIDGIRFDTLISVPVGPGALYTKIVAPSVPWEIFMLELDLKNPYTHVETVKGGDNVYGLEQPASMAARNDSTGHRVVAATNADFWGTYGVGNLQVSNGEFVRDGVDPGDGLDQAIFGVNKYAEPMLGWVRFDAEVRTKTQIFHYKKINRSRSGNDLIFFNRFNGVSTGTDASGTELLIRPLSEWLGNGLTQCVVESAAIRVGNMGIPRDKAVLSGVGTAETFLQTLSVGDTVGIFHSVEPGVQHLTQAVGGFTILVSNGVRVTTRETAREPRTSVGFNADSSKMYLWVVDGRYEGSAGMTYFEMADFMLSLGIAYGMNLDGGGSSAFMTRGVTRNRPSDGGVQRKVTNGILVVSTAPEDLPAARILIDKRKIRIFEGESVTLSLFGLDVNDTPVPLDTNQISFSVPARLGTITSNGFFTAAFARDSGYIVASYGGLKDSAFVVMKTVERIRATPRSFATDTIKTVTISVRAYDQDGLQKPFDASKLAFELSNAGVGVVSSTGIFKGTANGITNIIVTYDGTIGLLRDTLTAEVQIGTGIAVADSMESLTGKTVSGNNLNNVLLALSSEAATLGSNSLRASFGTVPNTSLPRYIYIDTNIPLFGVPDTVLIDVRADSSSYRVSYVIANPLGELFRWSTTSLANKQNMFATVAAPTAVVSAITGGATFYYPVTLTRLEVQVFGTVRQSGAVYLDNLRLRYPAGITSVPYEGGAIPRAAKLGYNYPNPFNPSTTIPFTITARSFVTLKVYDILGREVAFLVNGIADAGEHFVEWNAAGAPSGVYFCRLTAGNVSLSKKLVLTK